jgi:hypothetical protein
MAWGFHSKTLAEWGKMSRSFSRQGLTPKEILFDRKGKPSEAATALAQKIT